MKHECLPECLEYESLRIEFVDMCFKLIPSPVAAAQTKVGLF